MSTSTFSPSCVPHGWRSTATPYTAESLQHDTDSDLLADLNSRLDHPESARYHDAIAALRRELNRRGVDHR